MNIGLISLGCDKNRVDAEKMLGRLSDAGYGIVSDISAADVLIINTCAFIGDAKKESIERIFQSVELKKSKPLKIVVTGCFSTRYLKEAEKEIPEVDAFVTVSDEENIVETVDSLTGKQSIPSEESGRVLTTPPWYAYLKISDGCNNRCSYCVIPSIRGNYKSEKPEKLIDEAEKLCAGGVKELIVVAQDTTVYGIDVYKKPTIVPLLKELCKLDFWKIRLLYAYPEHVTDELLDFIDNEPKMAKYIDIPMQHIKDEILKRMNRRSSEQSIKELMAKIRAKKNYIAVRSSFIIGFPGETGKDNRALCDFVNENIDYAGFFVFSPEEGTPASSFDKKVNPIIASRRKARAEKAWQKGFMRRQKVFEGKTTEVICDGIDEVKGAFVGRTEYQTPEADTKVYFTADFNVVQGEVYKVRITEAEFDLYGFAAKEDNEI